MRALILLAALTASCNSKSINIDDTSDTSAVALNGLCEQEVRWGAFVVDANEDYAAVNGQVADGVVPMAVLTELLTEGECTIWRRENPFCDPGCTPEQTCSLEGECVRYPETQSLGQVQVNGLSTEVIMDPVAATSQYFDTSLDNPPWSADDTVTVRSEGGAFDPISLRGVAPTDLELLTPDWLLVPGEPFSVRWTPAPEGSRTEIVLELRVDQHGVTPSSLVCVFEDDGEGEVPASTFNELVRYGLTGFPAGSVRRRTADHVEIGEGGCVQLELQSSRIAQSIEVEGYTPCRRDEECPEGESCNVELERCE